MRARIVEFNNESGKVLKKGYVEYRYCFESIDTVDTPIIQIKVPDKRKSIDTCIDVPLRALLRYLKKKPPIIQKEICKIITNALSPENKEVKNEMFNMQ